MDTGQDACSGFAPPGGSSVFHLTVRLLRTYSRQETANVQQTFSFTRLCGARVMRCVSVSRFVSPQRFDCFLAKIVMLLSHFSVTTLKNVYERLCLNVCFKHNAAPLLKKELNASEPLNPSLFG